jgi:hypothetical protein
MIDEEQKPANENEVIYSAEYHTTKVLLSLVVVAFPGAIVTGGAYLAILAEEYLPAGLLLFLATTMLLVSLECVLFKQLLFYPNRVVKSWYLFGRRMIRYSDASVSDPQNRWRSSLHTIFESKDNGKPVPLCFPIQYHDFFFPPRTRKAIEMIMDYLTEDKLNSPRKFKKSKLPKEVVSQICNRSQQSST